MEPYVYGLGLDFGFSALLATVVQQRTLVMDTDVTSVSCDRQQTDSFKQMKVCQ